MAHQLATLNIGAVVVVEGPRPVGIITERDLVRAVSDDPAGWIEWSAVKAMTQPLRLISAEATVGSAIVALGRYHIRRLPVISEDGSLAGIITQTDLLRAAHQRLEQYLRDLHQLVYGVPEESQTDSDAVLGMAGHDIKNSLGVIETAREILSEAPTEVPSVLPLLGHATARIGNLVSTLVNLKRLQSGAMRLGVTDVSWAELCGRVVEEARLLGHTKTLRFSRTGETDASVRWDPVLIERVLLNLLDNAIHAAPAGSVIEIHGERQPPSSFLVRVVNSGPPLPPDRLAGLFDEPAGLSRHAAVRSRGSWGIGLAFCRLAVEFHSGTLRAISPYAGGQGVAFEFVLPEHAA